MTLNLKEIERFLATQDKKLIKAYLRSVRKMGGNIDIKTLEQLIAAYDLQGVISLIGVEVIKASYADFLDQVILTYVDAGRFIAARYKPFRTGSGVRINVSFNVLNPKTAQILEQKKHNLIRQVTKETREVIHEAMSRGIRAGENPLTVARDIRASIGLTRHQENAVQNFKASLKNNPREALDRALRDKRFDGSINRALLENKQLDPATIDKMVNRYRERYLKHRSEMIARTEVTEAMSISNHRTWQGMVEDDLITENRLRRYWESSHDSKTRHAHLSIARLNPNGVGLEESFKSELGPIKYPGDPAASAGNRINCRCVAITKIEDEDDNE